MKYLSFDRLIALTSIGLGILSLIQPTRAILGFVAINPTLVALLFIVPSLYLLYRKCASYAVFLLCTLPMLFYFLLFVFAYVEYLIDPTIRAPSLAIAWSFLMFYLLIQYVKSEMIAKDDS